MKALFAGAAAVALIAIGPQPAAALEVSRCRAGAGVGARHASRCVRPSPAGLGASELTLRLGAAVPARVQVQRAGGQGRDVERARGSGRVRRLRIDHFSTGAVAGTSPADFANAVAPLLVETPMREDVIERVTDLIAVYEQEFGAAFCPTQPACGAATAQALDSLETRVEGRCTASRQNAPTLRAIRDIVRMEALRARLGAEGDISLACREEVMRGIFDPARAAACGAGANPLGARAATGDLLREDGAGGDLDADGELTHVEFMFFLISPMQAAGLTDMATAAQTCAFTALEAIPSAGRTLCESNRAQAERDLQRALDYAQALGLIVLQPYIDALDFCRIERSGARLRHRRPRRPAAVRCDRPRPARRAEQLGRDLECRQRDDRHRRPLHGTHHTRHLHGPGHQRPEPRPLGHGHGDGYGSGSARPEQFTVELVGGPAIPLPPSPTNASNRRAR